MRAARARRLDHHFETLDKQSRYAAPIELHGGQFSEARVIRGSDGTDIHVWLCVCGAGGVAQSAAESERALADHIVSKETK